PARLRGLPNHACLDRASARESPVSTSANSYACHWCSTFADLYFHYASSTSAGSYSHCSTSAGLYWHHSSADLYPRHSCSTSADLYYHQPSLRHCGREPSPSRG